jgi:uncharacterized membrane protein HdeD (DUF308 family)
MFMSQETFQKPHPWRLVVVGIVLVVLGVLAIATPILAGEAVITAVGILLLVGGVGQLIHAARDEISAAMAIGIFSGILPIVCGIVLLFRPLLALSIIGLVLVVYFLVEGLTLCVLCFRMRRHEGRWWVLINGLLAIVLAVLLWRQWPLSGAWAVGVLVGVHILFTGVTMIVIGRGLGRMMKRAGELLNPPPVAGPGPAIG